MKSLYTSATATLLAVHLLTSVPFAFAGDAKMTITQKSPSEALGGWSLILPNNEKFDRTKQQTVEIPDLEHGRYTLIVQAPLGMTTKIEVLEGNSVIATADHPQVTFQLGNTPIEVSITYTLESYGTVSVSTDPAGVPFEIQGPNDFREKGITPHFYEKMPIGNYSVAYKPTGCPAPAAKSDQLIKDGRIDFSIVLKCETLVQEEKERTKETVRIEVDGKNVNFLDVPADAWFTPYVATVVRRGVITGYKNEDGSFSGMFGPGNPVTLAELSKIAHEMGEFNQMQYAREPKNERARETWFKDYYSSAEQRGWLAFQDPETDPGRPATRGEVISTFLQVVDVPMSWPKGKMFADVPRATKYAGEIETATANHLVSGTKNGSGLPLFHPDQQINRAEISKIIIAIQEKYQQDYDQ